MLRGCIRSTGVEIQRILRAKAWIAFGALRFAMTSRGASEGQAIQAPRATDRAVEPSRKVAPLRDREQVEMEGGDISDASPGFDQRTR